MNNGNNEENKNSASHLDFVTLGAMFAQIKASNEVILKNQASILAKLTNENAEELYRQFKDEINKEVDGLTGIFR